MADLTPAQLDRLADAIADRLAARIRPLLAAGPEPKRYETADGLAKLYQVHRATIDRWSANGKIPVMRAAAGGRKLYDVDAVAAALHGGTADASS